MRSDKGAVRPVRVGETVPSVATQVATSGSPPMSPRPDWPEEESGGGSRNSTCDQAAASAAGTGPAGSRRRSGTTGGTKSDGVSIFAPSNEGGGILDPRWLPLRRAVRELLRDRARPHVPDDLRAQLEQLLDDQAPWEGGGR